MFDFPINQASYLPAQQRWRRDRHMAGIIRIVPLRCTVRRADGTHCSRPACVLDRVRETLICWDCYESEPVSETVRRQRFVIPFDAPAGSRESFVRRVESGDDGLSRAPSSRPTILRWPEGPGRTG